MRIAVADRAGASGQAATTIGMYSGNVLSIDVHRNDGERGIDDQVVEFPEDDDLAELGLTWPTTLEPRSSPMSPRSTTTRSRRSWFAWPSCSISWPLRGC
jgi:hypothetical protein